jgi:hypothetical protein
LPHDDNQGGFFCAVFEKSDNWGNDIGGIKHDHGMQLNAWEDKSVRHKSITEELDEFAKWFEAEQKKHWDLNNVPHDKREDIGLSKMV